MEEYNINHKNAHKIPCLYYKGFINDKGYGIKWCSKLKRMTTAHRAIWIDFYNTKLSPNKDVMHICDRRNCIEVMHLELGTRTENLNMRTSEKASAGGRAGKGSSHNEKRYKCSCGLESTASGISRHRKASNCGQ